MRHVKRGGTYLRALGPSSLWPGSPDDTSFSKKRGGRWNPKGAFGALYLSGDADVARANGLAIVKSIIEPAASINDLIDPNEYFEVQSFVVSTSEFVDAVTAAGRAALSLPANPRVGVGHTRAQAIGASAYAAGENGIACKSAAWNNGEELAIFDTHAPTLASMRGPRVTFATYLATRVTSRTSRKKKSSTVGTGATRTGSRKTRTRKKKRS